MNLAEIKEEFRAHHGETAMVTALLREELLEAGELDAELHKLLAQLSPVPNDPFIAQIAELADGREYVGALFALVREPIVLKSWNQTYNDCEAPGLPEHHAVLRDWFLGRGGHPVVVIPWAYGIHRFATTFVHTNKSPALGTLWVMLNWPEPG